jgi:hypothetical protein
VKVDCARNVVAIPERDASTSALAIITALFSARSMSVRYRAQGSVDAERRHETSIGGSSASARRSRAGRRPMRQFATKQ